MTLYRIMYYGIETRNDTDIILCKSDEYIEVYNATKNSNTARIERVWVNVLRNRISKIDKALTRREIHEMIRKAS